MRNTMAASNPDIKMGLKLTEVFIDQSPLFPDSIYAFNLSTALGLVQDWALIIRLEHPVAGVSRAILSLCG